MWVMSYCIVWKFPFDGRIVPTIQIKAKTNLIVTAEEYIPFSCNSHGPDKMHLETYQKDLKN
ncbi:hypothetical protein T01_8151 [Trichinella spiralis]|uniref:Uncharacterized protein n=1 Tax=Trichinella spiralis TaxID=6334 RepID=A0A0V1BYU3_TRISP|nr:hypothetical protein T01_8151 [Trichinella spiralis]